MRLSEQIKPYQKSSGYYYEYPEQGSFKMAGNSYYNGVSNYSHVHALYNLNSQYMQLSGVYGPTDKAKSGGGCTINFYGDSRLLKSLETKYGDLPQDFSVGLEGVIQLKIEFIGNESYAIADVEIK